MKAVFRCDASRDIGSGHVYRCLTLADMLQRTGWECAFASTPETLEIVPLLLRKGYELLPPSTNAPCDLLTVDHYGLDEKYESKARAWARRIFVIDDLADRRHECNVLLDMTYGRDAGDYKALVPENCRILTGSAYTLLRPQFVNAREKSLERRSSGVQNPPRILISLGSTNIGNATGRTLATLHTLPTPLSIDIVLGASAWGFEDIKTLVQEPGPHTIRLLTDVADMARLMVEADISIGAGGTTSWERCCLGLPTILFVLADNQVKISLELEAAGAVLYAGDIQDFDPPKFLNLVERLLHDPGIYASTSRKAAAICDGKGTGRVVSILNDA